MKFLCPNCKAKYQIGPEKLAGRRVAKSGRIATPHQMLEASLDEMCALVAGSGGPTADELAR